MPEDATSAPIPAVHGWQATTTSERCPACDCPEAYHLFSGTDRLYRTTSREFAVVECRQCRLIRLSPWPDPYEIGEYYPPDYWFDPQTSMAGQLTELYRRLVLHDHVAFVRRALEKSGAPGTIVDVGCGGGLFLRMLSPRNHPVVGVDFSVDAAAVAWRSNGVPVVNCSFSTPPFAPGSCAAITMFHVLEHLYNPRSFLETAHELLHPEGRLIAQVPNAASWQFLLFGEAWNGIDIPRHLINFRDTDLEILFDHCGFEIVRRKYFSLRDNPAGLATSLAPKLDPMARRIQGLDRSPGETLAKNLLYFGLVLGALPFSLMEAACRAGSTIMVEARKKR